MTLPDTLLIAGVDLQSLPLIVENFSGLHAPGDRRGSNIIVPLAAGETGVRKVLAAYPFDVPVTITPDFTPGLQSSDPLVRRAQFFANLAQVQVAVNLGAPATFTRKLAAVGGGTLDTTCTGEFVGGLTPSMLNPEHGKVVLQFRNLDGVWYGSSVAPTIPATITVAGTTRTHRITLVLPGAGTLTNTTLGISVTVTAGATLTVQGQTTTGTLADVVAAGDPFGNWFALAPGSNAITWSGAGVPTISYSPAFL